MFVFPHYIESLEPEHTFLLPVQLHLLWTPFTYFFFHRTMALDRHDLLLQLEVVETQLLLARDHVQGYELMRTQLMTRLEQLEPGASASNAGAQVEPGAGAGANVEPGAGAHVDVEPGAGAHVEPGAGAHVEPGAGDDEGSPSDEKCCGHCGGTDFLILEYMYMCQLCSTKSKRVFRIHRHT